MWHLVYACTYLHVAFCVGISVQASLITVVGHNGRHFLNMSIVTFGLYFTNIIFSWATRQGFPVLSVPINSAQTQTRFPGAYGQVQGPRVWALGCTAVWLTTWYLQELLNDEETYHSTPIWHNLTSDPKEMWNMSATALLSVTGSSLNESVKGLKGF